MSARRQPDLATIGGRLKAERERLGMTQTAMAALLRMTKSVQLKWERGTTSPSASSLAAFGEAGVDVLFIVTGRREAGHDVQVADVQQPLACVTVRQALAMLDPAARHRLLLDLLASELRG